MGTFYDLRKLIEEYPYTAKQYVESLLFGGTAPNELDECRAIQQQIEAEDDFFLSKNTCPLCGVTYDTSDKPKEGGHYVHGYRVCDSQSEGFGIKLIRLLLTGETAKQRAWRVYAPLILGGRR